MSDFDWNLLSDKDRALAASLLGSERAPDLDIQPDGTPYLYRWWVTPRQKAANVYMHVQVASDPERPLHDHPWDNQSVILSGGYHELLLTKPPWGLTRTRECYEGQTYHRLAEEAHRLILPEGVPYTLTLFTTGPVRRDWGFWLPDYRGYPIWVSHNECIINTPDGRSVFKQPEKLR